MRTGTIVCECGLEFWFETSHEEVACIKCEKTHDVSHFPIIEPPKEGEEDEA